MKRALAILAVLSLFGFVGLAQGELTGEWTFDLTLTQITQTIDFPDLPDLPEIPDIPPGPDCYAEVREIYLELYNLIDEIGEEFDDVISTKEDVIVGLAKLLGATFILEGEIDPCVKEVRLAVLDVIEDKEAMANELFTALGEDTWTLAEMIAQAIGMAVEEEQTASIIAYIEDIEDVKADIEDAVDDASDTAEDLIEDIIDIKEMFGDCDLLVELDLVDELVDKADMVIGFLTNLVDELDGTISGYLDDINDLLEDAKDELEDGDYDDAIEDLVDAKELVWDIHDRIWPYVAQDIGAADHWLWEIVAELPYPTTADIIEEWKEYFLDKFVSAYEELVYINYKLMMGAWSAEYVGMWFEEPPECCCYVEPDPDLADAFYALAEAFYYLEEEKYFFFLGYFEEVYGLFLEADEALLEGDIEAFEDLILEIKLLLEEADLVYDENLVYAYYDLIEAYGEIRFPPPPEGIDMPDMPELPTLPDVSIKTWDFSFKTSLKLTYTLGCWTVTSVSKFENEAFTDQSFSVSGALGAVSVTGKMAFDPSVPAYKSASITLSLSFAGIDTSLKVAHDPSKMVYTLKASTECVSATLTFQDDCTGIYFKSALLKLTDISFCCGVTYDVAFSFTKANGFEYVKFTAKHLFPICCGIDFDLSIKFTTDYKEVSIKPVLASIGDACFTLYADVQWESEIHKLAGIDIYGWKIKCELGDCTYIEFLTALDPSYKAFKNLFKGDEFEYVKFGFCGPGCCGGTYKVDLAIYFDNGGGLFGISRFGAKLEIPVMSNFTVRASFSTLEPVLGFGWTFKF